MAARAENFVLQYETFMVMSFDLEGIEDLRAKGLHDLRMSRD
jgi:hypothetical protein